MRALEPKIAVFLRPVNFGQHAWRLTPGGTGLDPEGAATSLFLLATVNALEAGAVAIQHRLAASSA
jgi:hypothetical protein